MARKAGQQIDPQKEEKRIPPTAELMAKRTLWSNGKDPNQCGDTIGRLWAWNLLWSDRHAPDVLRDAGRSYAAAYWLHYQRTAAARIGGYSEMVASGGIRPLHIPDPLRDVIQEDRFRRMDAELGGVESRERRAVTRYCVAQQGQNDPEWLVVHIEGHQRDTEALRNEINYLTTKAFSSIVDRSDIRRQKAAKERELEVRLLELGRETRNRMGDIRALNMGLAWLADHGAREKQKRKDVA